MVKETKLVEKKKADPMGVAVYGENFEKFQRIAEFKDLIPSFKDWYYAEKEKENMKPMGEIIRSFNTEVCAPIGRKFHPSLKTIRNWRVKWNLDLMNRLGGDNVNYEIAQSRDIRQVIKMQEGREIGDGELEHGIKTLGGELLNDAIQMLKDDQQLEEIYDNDELMKRRSYIINVFSHATKLVHGKAALMLKASAEKRDTAGFLMNLLARATAGKVSDEELNVLKSAYAPKQNEQVPL